MLLQGCSTVPTDESFLKTCIGSSKYSLEQKGWQKMYSEETSRGPCLCILDGYKKSPEFEKYAKSYIKAGIKGEFKDKESSDFNSSVKLKCAMDGLKKLQNALKDFDQTASRR